MLNLYVASTRRKCGKTFISAGMAATMQSLGYSTTVYKPIQTSGLEQRGFMQSPDLTYVKTIDPYIGTKFTYLYKSDAEPLVAAETENEQIEIELIQNDFKKITSDCTIIDSDNGILSPIAPNLYNSDVVKRLKVPVLLITTPDENAINDTLLSINFMKENDIELRGVVINNIPKDCDKQLLISIPRLIEEYSDTNVLGLVENLGEETSPQDLISSILNGIDIESVFNVKIEKLDFV